MKKSFFPSIFFLVFFLLFLLNSSSIWGKETTPGKVIEMRLTHALPEADMRGRTFKFWADEVYKRTKGTVKVTVYPSESLLKTPEFFKAMVQKSVEIAHLPSTFISTEVKEIAPLDVPGFIDPDKLVKVDEAIKPIMQKIFNKYDIRYIFASHEGDTTFYMRKKKIIHSPSDLKGLRIRAHGYWVGKAISAWGGTPAFIPPADVSVAFERGTVDGGYTGWPFVMAFKLFEQAPYITWVGYQNMWAFIAITGEAWRRLTPEQQRIMDEVGVEAMKMNIKLLSETREKFKEMVKQRGGEIYNLTTKEKANFEAALKPLYSELGTYSGVNGKELMGILEKIK